MHDKVAVADDTVITGSFNFSNNAMKNAENILVIKNKALADQYAEYIQGQLKRYKSERKNFIIHGRNQTKGIKEGKGDYQCRFLMRKFVDVLKFFAPGNRN